MAIVDLQPRRGVPRLGPSISYASRTRNYRGALVNKLGLATQNIPRFTSDNLEYNTTVEDIGGWFDNSTGTLRERLTVPAGVSMVRLAVAVHFDANGSFIPGDDIFVQFTRNGLFFNEYGRQGVTPMNGPNHWAMSTLPLPCVPGDFFGIRITALNSGFAASTAFFADVNQTFGIEAVVG